MTLKVLVSITLPLTLLVNAFAATAEQPPKPIKPMMSLTAGQIGVFDHIEQPILIGVEYQSNSFEVYGFDIIPSVGYFQSEGGSQYLYTTLRYDYWLDQDWVITPLWGFGYFEDGDEIILGHEFEFVSGLEIAYEFENHHRIGLMFSHLSNAGLSSTNPGTETLVVSYSIPLDD